MSFHKSAGVSRKELHRSFAGNIKMLYLVAIDKQMLVLGETMDFALTQKLVLFLFAQVCEQGKRATIFGITICMMGMMQERRPR